MLGIGLSLIVSILKALWELAGKFLTNDTRKNSIDEYSLAFGGRLMGAILILPVIFFIPLRAITTDTFILLLSSTLLNAVATVTALKAVKYWDLSVVGPLSAFTIPFLIFSGYIIGWELPNYIWIIWVLLIFLWTYFLWISETKKWFLSPIQAIYKNHGSRYMLITAAIWSLTAPIDKLGILHYGVFLWMLYLNISIALFMTIYSLIYKRKSFKNIYSIPAFKKISLMTLLWGGTLLLQMFAMKLTLAVYVISIKRASWIFSVLLGAFFYKEKNIAWKLFATSVMLIGVLVIIFWANI